MIPKEIDKIMMRRYKICIVFGLTFSGLGLFIAIGLRNEWGITLAAIGIVALSYCLGMTNCMRTWEKYLR